MTVDTFAWLTWYLLGAMNLRRERRSLGKAV
jgi:hypothetical protein